jgi:hypothetical protein
MSFSCVKYEKSGIAVFNRYPGFGYKVLL